MDAGAEVKNILTSLMEKLGVSYKGLEELEIAGQKIISIQTDDARKLIGMHGDTVHAIDFLVKKMLEKRLALAEGEEMPLYLIDVNDYRTKQIKDLQTKALMMADRARSFQYDVELTPMSAYERLIIHTTLQDAPNVRTESLGEGRNRRVVIKYAA
jgi:spoIIIJ-associated protein